MGLQTEHSTHTSTIRTTCQVPAMTDDICALGAQLKDALHHVTRLRSDIRAFENERETIFELLRQVSATVPGLTCSTHSMSWTHRSKMHGFFCLNCVRSTPVDAAELRKLPTHCCKVQAGGLMCCMTHSTCEMPADAWLLM